MFMVGYGFRDYTKASYVAAEHGYPRIIEGI